LNKAANSTAEKLKLSKKRYEFSVIAVIFKDKIAHIKVFLKIEKIPKKKEILKSKSNSES
jgi:hypothetical protein